MASEHQNLSEYNKEGIKNAKGFRFGIVTAQWNKDITFSLRDGCIQALKDNGFDDKNITSIEVPGAFELTLGAKYLLEHKEVDAVICLGCIIKGATKHDEYIAIASVSDDSSTNRSSSSHIFTIPESTIFIHEIIFV